VRGALAPLAEPTRQPSLPTLPMNTASHRPLARFWRQGLATVFAALLAAPLSAQDGILTGRVTDANSGAGLPGAIVTVLETGRQTATDREGSYTIGGLPAGEIRVQFSYLGFEPQTDTVRVAAGQRTTLNARLGGETVVMGEFYVTSIRDAQAAALNQQRAAENLTSVVSSDSIGRFPDPNIAEALQRVPGIAVERDQGEGRYINIRGAPVEFSSVQIDGVSINAPDHGSRGIDLDTIPSDIVNTLEITKALRPDQDADGIAGAVNIITESAFTATGFRLRGTAGLSYNDLGGTRDTRGSMLVSNVFGAERNFGLLLSGSWSVTRREVDNVENEWELVRLPEGGEGWRITDTVFKDYDTRRERRALTGQAEWRPQAGHRLFLRGTFSSFEDNEFRNRLGIIWDDGILQPGSTDTAAEWDRVRLTKQVRNRIVKNEILTLAAGGEHELGRGLLDYTASFTRSDQTYPRRAEILYRTSTNLRLRYDTGVNRDTPFYSLFETNQHLELNRFSFRENTSRSNTTREEEFALGANYSIPAAFGGNDSRMQFGAKYRTRDKSADEERFRGRSEPGVIPAPPLAQMVGTTRSDNYNYNLGFKIDPAKALDYFATALPSSPRRMPESITADYTADEEIFAGYGQTRIDLGPLDILTGLRVEHTKTSGRAPVVATNGAISMASVSRSYTNLFPGAHARYNFSDALVGRASFTRGIARPNYTAIVPKVVESTDGSTIRVNQGNPALRATTSNNYDASLDYYLGGLGVISGAVFYKDINNYLFVSTSRGIYQGEQAIITRPENADSGKILGLELAYQQQFTQLPGALSGVGVFFNYTWTDSEITAPMVNPATGLSDLRRKTQLPGQSKQNYNVGIYFENFGFNARLAYTTRSEYLDDIYLGAEGADLDTWWDGRSQLDFTTSYQLTRQLQIFAEAKNLTNTAGVRYYGNRNRVYEYEKFGWSVFGGIKFNF
jgi:TonB-dependent receptor